MTRWSTKQLCSALQLSQQRISQLCKGGVLPQPEDGKHDPFKAVPAYIRFISTRVAGGDLKSARIAKYAVETALRELELKQKSSELVDRSAVENEFFRIARTVRDNFQNLPARTAGLLAAETNQQRCYDLVTKEVDQILEGLTRDAGNGADVRPAPPPRRKNPPPPPRRAS